MAVLQAKLRTEELEAILEDLQFKSIMDSTVGDDLHGPSAEAPSANGSNHE